MNLSLIVAVILIAVVLPWLFRQVFPASTPRETTWLEPVLPMSAETAGPGAPEPLQVFADSTSVLSADTVSAPLSVKKAADAEQKDLFAVNQLCIIYVMAPREYFFVGYELLQALQNAGLIYGARQIFHYYPDDTDDDTPLFSVASAVEPGIFDLQQIGAYATPGLTLFMDPAKFSDAHIPYQLMLQTAQHLAEELNGKVILHDS